MGLLRSGRAGDKEVEDSSEVEVSFESAGTAVSSIAISCGSSFPLPFPFSSFASQPADALKAAIDCRR
jgi:hypothetical protein